MSGVCSGVSVRVQSTVADTKWKALRHDVCGVLHSVTPPVQMIGLYQDPSGEKDVALRGLQAIKTMQWGTVGAAETVQALDTERDALKMEIQQVHTVS